MITTLMSVLIVLGSVVTLWALGRKYRWGWLVNVAVEGPWLYMAYVWRSWAVVVLSFLYGGLALRNWVLWGQDE